MATIDECKRTLQYRVTKSGFNGNLSPSDFNLIWNRAEQRYFNFLYKQYGINQDNVDSLVRFKTDPTSITIDGTGKYTKTTDLLHIDSIRREISGKQVAVKKVEDDRLAAWIDSVYDAPTLLNPIYVEYKSYIQFYPITVGNALLVYLKKLTPALWSYTIVGDRPLYNAITSVQPSWSDVDIDEIIYLCGVDLGVNTKSPMDIQFNDVKAKENA